MLKNQITKKIENTIVSLTELKNNFKAQKSEYERKTKEYSDFIIKSFIKSGTDNCKIDTPNGAIKVKLVTPHKIIWDVDKLISMLPKKMVSEVVTKRYSINDMEGLAEYLKSCGVNPKKFMTFLDVDKSVNQSVLDDLVTQKVITEDQLKTCCSVIDGTSYLKITEQEVNSNAKDS